MARKSEQESTSCGRSRTRDLLKEMDETYRQLFTARLQVTTRQLANTSLPRKLRQRIARIKTIQRERELAAAHAAVGAER